MKLVGYVALLNDYLAQHPEHAELQIFIGNGYCTSEEYVAINRAPYPRKIRVRKAGESGRVAEEVLFLL
jgi:hypothetical protein